MSDKEEKARVLLGGESITFEEGIALAQLVNQPGWKVYVRLIAEACRRATDEVIKLDPQTERHGEKLIALQITARAKHSFAALLLDSVKVHQRNAVKKAQQRDKVAEEKPAQAPRFRMPMPKSDEVIEVAGTIQNQS